MSLRTIVGATAGIVMKQKITARNYHIYRPVSYCDWYKPPDSFYYELRCPPEPPKKVCKPAVVVEKRCAVCSFWQQMKDNCRGFFWPIPPTPIPAAPKVHICNDPTKKIKGLGLVEDVRRKPCFVIEEDCCDIPKIPKANWQVFRKEC